MSVMILCLWITNKVTILCWTVKFGVNDTLNLNFKLLLKPHSYLVYGSQLNYVLLSFTLRKVNNLCHVNMEICQQRMFFVYLIKYAEIIISITNVLQPKTF